jgi:ATP-dependent Clp protease ATP-binding subunit ClpC
MLRQYAPSREDRVLPRHRFTPTPHTAALRRSTYAALSEPAREVMQLAQDVAARLKHNYIGSEHLLLGLLRQDGGAATQALADLGVSAPKVRLAVEFIIGKGDREIPGLFNLTPRATRAVELSLDEAQRLGQQTISSGHLVLGLVREGEGVAASVLESMTVSLGRVRDHVLDVLHGPQSDD